MGSPIKSILATALIALSLDAFSSCGAGPLIGTQKPAGGLSEDEKHRLYTAALAASESPLDSELFGDVCKKIGIYDAKGKPTDKYMPFIQAHIDWGTRPDNERFRQEINSKEKARDYLTRYLSAE